MVIKMKYKKFLLLPSVIILYILFINLISIDYEIYGTSYSVLKNPLSGTGGNEQIAASHQLEVVVKRHRELFGLLPSYGFRNIGVARGNLVMYNPGPLKIFHLAFLGFFIILTMILVFLEISAKKEEENI
jgi:hypothetical protein